MLQSAGLRANAGTKIGNKNRQGGNRQRTREKRRVGRAGDVFVGLGPSRGRRACNRRSSLLVLLQPRVEVRVRLEQFAQRLLALGAIAAYHSPSQPDVTSPDYHIAITHLPRSGISQDKCHSHDGLELLLAFLHRSRHGIQQLHVCTDRKSSHHKKRDHK